MILCRDVLLAALAVSGAAAAEIYKLEKRDGAGHHHHEHQPEAQYSQPEAQYSQPQYPPADAYDQGFAPAPSGDLTPIIIAVLVLTGISLLFPAFVQVNRRRRSLDEDVSPAAAVMERVNDIYMSVVESEECMERIACEVGGLARDFGMTNSGVLGMMDPFVGGKYKTYYKQFKTGTNCRKIKCGTFSL